MSDILSASEDSLLEGPSTAGAMEKDLPPPPSSVASWRQEILQTDFSSKEETMAFTRKFSSPTSFPPGRLILGEYLGSTLQLIPDCEPLDLRRSSIRDDPRQAAGHPILGINFARSGALQPSGKEPIYDRPEFSPFGPDLGPMATFNAQREVRLPTVCIQLGKVSGIVTEETDKMDESWTDTGYHLLVDISQGKATSVWLVYDSWPYDEEDGDVVEAEEPEYFKKPDRVLFLAPHFKDLTFQPGKDLQGLDVQSLPIPAIQEPELVAAVFQRFDKCFLVREFLFQELARFLRVVERREKAKDLSSRQEKMQEMSLQKSEPVQQAWEPYSYRDVRENAAEMYRWALEGRENAWGREHTYTLDTVNELGALYLYQGKLEEAEKLLLRALAGRKKAHGPEHPSTLDTIYNLGALYFRQGRWEDVRSLCLQAIAGHQKSRDADSDGATGKQLRSTAEQDLDRALGSPLERRDASAYSSGWLGWRVLGWAAEQRLEGLFHRIFEQHQDLKDDAGWTLFIRVAAFGHEAVVRLLLERSDVEADSKDRWGRTPLSYAAESGNEAVVRLLLKRSDVEADSRDLQGRTPLSYAAAMGEEAVVRLLLERSDVEADSRDDQDRTPLSYAAGSGNEAVVRLLLERSDIEVDLKTPLRWAAANGHEAVVRLLLERSDVEVDSKDHDGRTPLSYAAGSGREAVVRLFLERGDVEVDSKDDTGRTPLDYALRYMSMGAARALEEAQRSRMDSS